MHQRRASLVLHLAISGHRGLLNPNSIQNGRRAVVLEASDHDALVHAVGEVRMRPRERRMAAWAASRATADLQVFVSGAFGEGNKCLHSCVRELAPHRLQATLGLDPGSAAARTATSPTSATAMCSSSSRALAASTFCARIATARTSRDAVLACEGSHTHRVRPQPATERGQDV